MSYGYSAEEKEKAENAMRKRFCDCLNKDQIEKLYIWLRYAERYVEGKIARSLGDKNGEDRWRSALHEINIYQMALREAHANPKIHPP